jgi:hypothetical protein
MSSGAFDVFPREPPSGRAVGRRCGRGVVRDRFGPGLVSSRHDPSGPRRRALAADDVAPGFWLGDPPGDRPAKNADGLSCAFCRRTSSGVLPVRGRRRGPCEVGRGGYLVRGDFAPSRGSSFGNPGSSLHRGCLRGGSGADAWCSLSGELPRVSSGSTARSCSLGSFPQRPLSGVLGRTARNALFRECGVGHRAGAPRLRRFRQAWDPIRRAMVHFVWWQHQADAERIIRAPGRSAVGTQRDGRPRWGKSIGPPGHRALPAAGLRTSRWRCTGSAALAYLPFVLCRWFAELTATSATRFGDLRTFAFTHTWKRTLLSRCLCTRRQGHGRKASVKCTSSAPGRAAKTVESRGLEPRGHGGSAQPIRR